MTDHRDLKNIIRERQTRTGESYAAARLHVLRARDQRLGLTAVAPDAPHTVEAAVIKVNLQSLRIRILGETDQITVRISALRPLIPGHLVTLELDRRWTFRGDAYATGCVKGSRLALDRLGLEPLPLTDYGPMRVAATRVSPGERASKSRPRRAFEMHPIAWDAVVFATKDHDDCRVDTAADLAAEGNFEQAYTMLMEVLAVDLRCIDAHAGLGSLFFDRSVDASMAHYEVGVKLGEQWLGPAFDGLLPWSMLNNRPFLRSLHGLGLCLWRRGRLEEAARLFDRLLALNPDDNQGVRFCLRDVKLGRTWAESVDDDRSSQTLH